MATEVSTYLKYVDLQMAAESLFAVPKNAAPGVTSLQMRAGTLTLGNERSSRFTAIQARQFLDEGWTVAEHKSNTSTGFSGTLLRNSKTGEFVLSFRSTEFADDAARDNQATNVTEIKAEGWALGQIADMEKWFSQLKASGKLSATDRLSVTGYSLGGHLATVFNLLHGYDLTSAGEPLITSTYTFNGAGVGEVLNGKSLAQVISEFNAYRVPGNNAGLFADADVRARYDRLKDLFKEGATISLAQVDAEMQSRAQQGLVRAEELTLYNALERIRSIVWLYGCRVAGGRSSSAWSVSC